MGHRRRLRAPLLAAIVLSGCSRQSPEVSATPARPAVEPIPCPGSLVPDGSADQMVGSLADAYRLRPDRRFLLAFAELDRLHGVVSAGRPEAAFRNGHWELTSGGTTIATLPEFPGFESLAGALLRRAEDLAKSRPIAWGKGPEKAALDSWDEAVDSFRTDRILDAIRAADEAWGRTGPARELLLAAERGSARLALVTRDDLEVGDALAAHALAMLAAAKAAGLEPASDETALLAGSLGYAADARSLAEALPAGDPVRLFLAHRDSELLRVVSAGGHSKLAGYLWLSRLAARGEAESWEEWRVREFADAANRPGIIESGFALHGFDQNGTLSGELARQIVELSEGLSNAKGGTPGRDRVALTERLDSSIAAIGTRSGGPLLGLNTIEAYLRSAFFSATATMIHHLADEYSSAEALASIEPILGSPKDGPSADLRKYFDLVLLAKNGSQAPEPFYEILTGGSSLGFSPLLRFNADYSDRIHWSDRELLVTTRALFRRADSRVSHRVRAGASLAAWVLRDQPLGDRLVRSAIEAGPSPDPWQDLWWVTMWGRPGELKRLLGSGLYEFRYRVEALADADAGRDDMRSEIEESLKESSVSARRVGRFGRN